MGNLTANVHPGIIRITPPAYTGSYTVTPDEQGSVLETNGKVMTDDVTINAVPWVKPEGSKSITTNGTHDVEAYQTAVVAVPGPSGTKTITTNGTHDVEAFAAANVQVPQGVFPTGTKSITANGTYDVTNFASADVNIDTAPAYGVIPETMDANGNYGGHVKMYGYSVLPAQYCYGSSGKINAMRSAAETIEIVSDSFDRIGNSCFENHVALKTFIFPASTRSLGFWMIGDYCFRGCTALETIIARGNLTLTSWFGGTAVPFKQLIVGGEVSIPVNPNFGDAIELLDFRGCTSVPALPDASWLAPAGTCTIKCKQSLVSQWQNATNWNAVPNLVWEGDPNAD